MRQREISGCFKVISLEVFVIGKISVIVVGRVFLVMTPGVSTTSMVSKRMRHNTLNCSFRVYGIPFVFCAIQYVKDLTR